MLLFGDLAHDTIMKIFDYSEYYDREQYLSWDLLLAPHHCSKRVMYQKDSDGNETAPTGCPQRVRAQCPPERDHRV